MHERIPSSLLGLRRLIVASKRGCPPDASCLRFVHFARDGCQTARKLISRPSPFRSLKLPLKSPVKVYRTTARSNCIERDGEPCCSAKNLQSLSAALVFLWAPAAEIGLLARPTAAAVLVVINVLRFMVMEWFGFSVGRAMQLLRLELRPPSAWRRRPSDSLLLLQPCGFWLVRRTTVRGPG